MHNKIYLYLLLILPLLGLGSCTDDDLTGGTFSPEGNVPVEFTFLEPTDGLDTRGTDEYKQMFQEGDVIHVQGTFTDANGATAISYGAMKLTARKWVPIEGATLYWPYDAVKGKFTAYYIYNSDYILNNHSSTPEVYLADIQDGQDPLEAESKELLYGYAAEMQFTHACTYLTLEKLEQNVTDYYWMVFPANDTDIKNAYRLSRNGGELQLEFVSIPDPDAGGLVYVSSPSLNYTAEDGQRYSMASFYLAPGKYNYFDLRTNNNFPFMSFLNSLKEDLLANHPYTLNVENAKGASFEYTTEVDWDEDGGSWKVNVKDFLEAVNKGNEYNVTDTNGEKVPILKKSTNGTLLLMHNLNFEYFEDYNFEEWGFLPDVANGTTLNGNLHYIENIGHPVFRFNLGTIENLGLRNFKANVTAYERSSDNNYKDDFSRIGGLCCWNRTDARIENIRLENFDLTVKVKSEDPMVLEHNENYNIGLLCGDNYGWVSDITLKGNFKLTVQAYDNLATYSYVDANLNLGGIIGNHYSYLSNVGPQAGASPTITIINQCHGRDEWGSGVFCIGGAVGQSTGNDISQVVINNVKIEATSSDGYQQHIGGLVGRLRGNGYTVSDCTVQGDLTCGTVSNYGTFSSSFSYMGGIAGNVRGYTVSNCRAVCNVHSNPNTSDGATYATGGAFGRIQSEATLIDNTAFGTQLSGPSSYIGTFAGIANDIYTWSFLESMGNTARQIGLFATIGQFINDTSND